MELSLRKLTIPRKRPLTISRGTSSVSENLFVAVSHDGIEGLGEAAPIGYGREQTADTALTELSAVDLSPLAPWQIISVEVALRETGSATRSAVVNACYDWLGKRAEMPTYQLLGLNRSSPATSITVGINPPKRIRELVPELLKDSRTHLLKQKLGGDGGIEADKERFLAAKDACPEGTRIRVDANGGWQVNDAITMVKWLAGQGCDYVEQPLGFGNEDGLKEIMKVRTLPIFVDEFVSTSNDVPKFVGLCDGLNVKLMKSGGIAEAMRLVHTARAHGMSTMIGCFGETSIGIAAGVAIGSLFDHIDLDSHLNMEPDPARGIENVDGIMLPSEQPGLGVAWK